LFALFGVLAFALWYWRRQLFSRTASIERRELHWAWSWRWLVLFGRWIARSFGLSDDIDPTRLYHALLIWGRRTGIPHRPSETPLEYAGRLQACCGFVSSEIALIVATFNLHVYGQRACDHERTCSLRKAFRRLRSPRLWPKRLWLWFTDAGAASVR
jgi:hypothetical protein